MTIALATATTADLARRIAWMDALAASIRAEIEESRRALLAMETRR